PARCPSLLGDHGGGDLLAGLVGRSGRLLSGRLFAGRLLARRRPCGRAIGPRCDSRLAIHAAAADARRGARRRRRHLHPGAGVVVEPRLPPAPLARAAPHRAVALGPLLGDEPGGAARTRLHHGLVPHRERACGIAVAAEERVPALGAALVELALAAHEAPDAGGDRFEQRLDGLALRVARTAEELAEAAEAHLHGPAADVARAVGQLRLDRVDRAVLGAREVGGVATLGVAAAGEELATPAPLDHHGLAAAIAHELGGSFLALDVAHLDLGTLEVLSERRPEAAHRRHPVLLAFFDEVELVLHAA